VRALVTGADGFIGSHLTELLINRGWDVRALAQYNSFNSRGWLEDVSKSKQLEVISGDIRDPFFCDKLCEGVDTVFHLAALIAIPFSYAAPQSYVETNVTGTLNVCFAAKRNKVKRLIHTSTSEVYGSAKQVPINEDHPLQPQSPYSASKIGADAMALSFFNSYELPVCVARPFNTYGPRQSARAVIPTIITQLAAGATSLQLGDATPTRDFNFVEDTCAGFLLLAEGKNVEGQVYNIGSGQEISIHDTAQLIGKIMNKKFTVETDEQRIRPKNSEVNRLCCDVGKLKEHFGYKQEYTFEKGLRKTIEWFSKEENLRKYKANEYNV